MLSFLTRLDHVPDLLSLVTSDVCTGLILGNLNQFKTCHSVPLKPLRTTPQLPLYYLGYLDKQ